MYKLKDIEYWIIIFLGLFLFGFLIHGLTFIKNIGLYGSIFFFIIKIFTNKSLYLYKEYYINNKILLNSFLIFLISVFISVIFAYSDIKPSLKEFRIEFLHIGIFMLISLSVFDKKFLYKVLLYSVILAFIYDVIIYGYEYYLHNSNLNFSIRLNRNAAVYLEILYPFVLGSFFVIKNKFKYLLMIFIFFGLFELLLTSARGAWGSVFIETLLFLFFILYLKRDSFKKILIVFILGGFIVGSGSVYLYKHSELIKNKIKLGFFNTTGRDKIIKTRLPIFLKYENLFIGIGGPGNYQYNEFLNDYKAPRVLGIKDNKKFHYWSDEPFLLQIFYKEGILGLITYLIFSFIFLYIMFKFIKKNSNNREIFIALAIFSSYIGYYFVRGLVENRDFKYMILYLTLFLLIKESKNVKNS